MDRRQHLITLAALGSRTWRFGRLRMGVDTVLGTAPALAGGAAVAALGGCAGASPAVQLTGRTMGTQFSVTVLASLDEGEALRRSLAATLDAIDARMSTYRTDSELSRFNRSPAGRPVSVSTDTLAVARVAERVAALSRGAFDATVGPVVDLWGFGPAARGVDIPSDEALARAAARVGHGAVVRDEGRAALAKRNAGTRLDFSGIAKGFAVDALARALEQRGLHDYAVDIGGEVRASGSRPDGAPWRVGIERPQFGAVLAGTGQRPVLRVIQAHAHGAGRLAAATSGTYQNYFERGGVRYSHSIDPRTARPVAHALVSVTVVADDAVTADAWATALLVLGPREARAVADDQGLAAHFLTQRDGRFRADWSARMADFLAAKGA